MNIDTDYLLECEKDLALIMKDLKVKEGNTVRVATPEEVREVLEERFLPIEGMGIQWQIKKKGKGYIVFFKLKSGAILFMEEK